MNLAVVSKYPPMTEGVGDYARHVAGSLAGRADVNRVTILANAERTTTVAAHPGVEIRRVWRPDDPALVPRLIREIVHLRPDAVWYNVSLAMFGESAFALGGFLLPAITRRLGIQSVVTLHEMPVGPFSDLGFQTGLRQRTGVAAAVNLLRGGNVLCVTIDRFRRVLDPEASHRDTIVHIPLCGYEEPVLDPFEGPPTALIMACMAPHKGVDVLIEAFRLARRTVPNARLVVAGIEHPRFPGFLTTLRRDVGEQPGITWLGTVPDDDVRRTIQAAHVVVAPYQVATGSSATVHRAVALGRPVVVSDLPEFRSMAREEDLWLEYVPRDDPGQLAVALQRLWTDSERRDSIARHNYASAQRHSLTSTTDAYLRLFYGQTRCPSRLAITRSTSSAG